MAVLAANSWAADILQMEEAHGEIQQMEQPAPAREAALVLYWGNNDDDDDNDDDDVEWFSVLRYWGNKPLFSKGPADTYLDFYKVLEGHRSEK